MKTEKYELSIQSTITCPARAAVLKAIDDGTASFVTVIGKEKVMNCFPAYVDKIEQSALFGLVKTATDASGNLLDEADISALIDVANKKVVITGHSGNVISATITIDMEDIVEEKVSYDDVMSVAREKIDQGIISVEDMNEKLKVFEANNVDPALVRRIISEYKTHNKPPKRPETIYVDPEIDKAKAEKREGIISEGLRSASMSFGTLLEGEKSTGKNTYADTIAWLLHKPQYLITMSRQMRPSAIYGEKTTDNSGIDALRKFDPKMFAMAEIGDKIFEKSFDRLLDSNRGDFMDYNDMISLATANIPKAYREAMERRDEFQKLSAQCSSPNIIIDSSELYDAITDGGVLILNEMNLAEPNMLSSFTNQLLDGTGFIFIPGRGEVQIRKDFVLMGTQNADYEGTQQQNEATMSRFNCIYFPQPDSIKKQLVAAVESQLKKHGCDAKLNKAHVNTCEVFYKQLREANKSGVISNAALNIRGFVRALTTVTESAGVASLRRWLTLCVINTCPADERQTIKNQLVVNW